MRANYGIDAPGLVRTFLFVGLGSLAASVFLLAYIGASPWAIWFGIFLLIPAIYSLGMCGLMLWGSLVTKVSDRESILDLVTWQGNETVLDVGCGRGLMMVAAARRAIAGTVVNVDIWSAKDQSSNRQSAPLKNANRRSGPPCHRRNG